MKRVFDHEVGMVISSTDQVLTIVHGELGHVDFPEELIWKLHKMNPGCIGKLVHTHPDGMVNLSQVDKRTMEQWSHVMYPFPIVLSVICAVKDGFLDRFREIEYTSVLEPKELWERRGKEGLRKFDIYATRSTLFTCPDDDSDFHHWSDVLVRESYPWQHSKV